MAAWLAFASGTKSRCTCSAADGRQVAGRYADPSRRCRRSAATVRLATGSAACIWLAVKATAGLPDRRSCCSPCGSTTSIRGRNKETRITNRSAIHVNPPRISRSPPWSLTDGTVRVAASGHPPASGFPAAIVQPCRACLCDPGREAVFQVSLGDEPVERVGGNQQQRHSQQGDPQLPAAPHVSQPWKKGSPLIGNQGCEANVEAPRGVSENAGQFSQLLRDIGVISSPGPMMAPQNPLSKPETQSHQ